MRILIIGGGGREHALAWKLRQSPRVTGLFCAPGNGGLAETATCIPFKVTEIDELIRFAQTEQIALTVIGPDDALAAGMADRFAAAGLRVFGPTQSAARLESSKGFAKHFMERHGIPTARAGRFSDPEEAKRFAREMPKPVVVKADGLALGKGVIIAATDAEAEGAIQRILVERVFGSAGKEILVEEFLRGTECSVHALVDGESYLLFPSAQDHKRALNGDHGLNTGGMGTISPCVAFTPDVERRVREEVLDRFLAGLKADGLDYRGLLFPGLMLTADGPRVLEFNCRFGDPETQVLLMRLETDLLELLEATIDQQLHRMRPQWSSEAAVCVVMASGGYPENYTTGETITGLETRSMGCEVFHAGTARLNDGTVTAGGRVLGVTARGANVPSAREHAYERVRTIHFRGAHFRTDIGLAAAAA